MFLVDWGFANFLVGTMVFLLFLIAVIALVWAFKKRPDEPKGEG